MDWNFQSVKCLNELVQQYGGRKSSGREAELQGRIEHAHSMEGDFVVTTSTDLSAGPFLKVASLTSNPGSAAACQCTNKHY